MRMPHQSLAWCPNHLDLAVDRGAYERNARPQLCRVFIYLSEADGHLATPERQQIDHLGKGQIVPRRKVSGPPFGNPCWRLPWARLCRVPGQSQPGQVRSTSAARNEISRRAKSCTLSMPPVPLLSRGIEPPNVSAFGLFAECQQRAGRTQRMRRVALPLKPPKTVFYGGER